MQNLLCVNGTAICRVVTGLFHVLLTSLREGGGDTALTSPMSIGLSCAVTVTSSVGLGSPSRASGHKNDLKLSLCSPTVALHTSIQQCSQAWGNYFYAFFFSIEYCLLWEELY